MVMAASIIFNYKSVTILRLLESSVISSSVSLCIRVALINSLDLACPEKTKSAASLLGAKEVKLIVTAFMLFLILFC